ncbi:hypothetical protein KGF42_08770 [Clostridioides sp. ZZV15-6383]|uniref:YkvI family membrane protein n=1 Tax=unclassified Clostridioides TaxID=2635829 RepID=UPI0006BBA2F8|nr:membrane protein [Clostridioides difficile]MCC0683414.1 hypothetical protein [Clostridioides sp. ZZV14-6345]MCC0699516.1 hypothetical protein [Clostridioides sp. ZZV15-6383]
MSGKVNIKTVISFAGAYVATVIGSGFATGQEILQFFTFYGYAGIIGGIISMILFSWFGAEVIEKGRELKLKEPIKIYQVYCGKYLGTFFEWFGPLFLFGTLVIMIAGAGATLSEYYGLNPYVGRIGMAIVSLITVSLGLTRLSKILGNIGPIIIIFTLLVGAISLFSNIDALSNAGTMVDSLNIKTATSNGYFSGVLYTCYNVIIVITFLTGMGASAVNKKDAVWGGIVGGVALMAAAIMMNLALLSDIGNIYTKEIPALYLADKISPIIGILFSVVLLLGIYTTAVPLLWSVTNRFVEDDHPKFKIITIVVSILACIGGLLPFDKLVGTLYPYTGYMGILILLCMLYRRITKTEGYKENKSEIS